MNNRLAVTPGVTESMTHCLINHAPNEACDLLSCTPNPYECLSDKKTLKASLRITVTLRKLPLLFNKKRNNHLQRLKNLGLYYCSVKSVLKTLQVFKEHSPPALPLWQCHRGWHQWPPQIPSFCLSPSRHQYLELVGSLQFQQVTKWTLTGWVSYLRLDLQQEYTVTEKDLLNAH